MTRPQWASAGRTWAAVLALLVLLAGLTLTDLWLERHTGAPVGMPMSSEATKPDLLLGYDRDTVVTLFDRYGSAGRQAYGVGLIVDTAYPLALAAATVLLAARAFGTRRRWLWLAPGGFAVLDVIENIGLGIALATYPEIPTALIVILSPVTVIKLLCFPPTVLLLIAAATMLGYRRLAASSA